MFKRRLCNLFLLAALSSGVGIVHAQQNEISESEFRSKIAESRKKRIGVVHRQSIRTEGYSPGESSETIYEYAPNGSSRTLSIRRVGGVETKSETIRIGSNLFVRENDGDWKKLDVSAGIGTGSGIGSGSGSGSGQAGNPPKVEVSYVYVGKDRVGDENVNRYKMTRTITFSYPRGDIVRTATEEYWYREDGMLLKEIREDMFLHSRYRRTVEYDYKSEIKIEPPIE